MSAIRTYVHSFNELASRGYGRHLTSDLQGAFDGVSVTASNLLHRAGEQTI